MAPLTHLYSKAQFAHIIQKHIFSVTFSGIGLCKTVVLFFALVLRYPSLTFLLSPQYNGCELNFLCVVHCIEKWHLENSAFFLAESESLPVFLGIILVFWQEIALVKAQSKVCSLSMRKRTVILLRGINIL